MSCTRWVTEQGNMHQQGDVTKCPWYRQELPPQGSLSPAEDASVRTLAEGTPVMRQELDPV